MLQRIREILNYRRTLIVILTPIILLPMILVNDSKPLRCAYMVILMGTYWMTEAIPLAVTALIPMVMVPMFGIAQAKQISICYMMDTNMLFVGGLIVAMAVEHTRLHERIALSILRKIPVDPKWLTMGFMAPTWILSMWISNTAATAMMLPIVNGVIETIQKKGAKDTKDSTHDTPDSKKMYPSHAMVEAPSYEKSLTPAPEVSPMVPQPEQKEWLVRLSKACNLCIAYSATCGGMVTLTGTGSNLILHGVVTGVFGSKPGLNFGTWILYGLPISFVFFLLCWAWLLIYFWGPREAFFPTIPRKERLKRRRKIQAIFIEEYNKLGSISFGELSVVGFLVVLVGLWLSKDPGVDGWIRLFMFDGKKFCSDSTPAVLIAILVMIWPAIWPFSKEARQYGVPSLLPWPYVQSNFPLGIVLLIGGGFAMAEACEKSGLSSLVGQNLMFLHYMPIMLLIPVLSLVAATLTNVTSNTAVTSILIPILIPLASCLGVNPLLLLLPTTVSCSFAFCLPVATPCNAIVFARGVITVKEMAQAGIVLNLLAVVAVTIVTLTLGSVVFHVLEVPDWLPPCTFNNTMIGTFNTTMNGTFTL